MAIEIFWGSGSGPSWRVLLALAFKKLPFESHLLSFSKGEHKSPEMLAMNPRGKVPVLKDGAFHLAESLAICSYVIDKAGSDLGGRTPQERAVHGVSLPSKRRAAGQGWGDLIMR